jgi:CRP/FNR family transcriptional regulator, cyclic AMP receptor protein
MPPMYSEGGNLFQGKPWRTTMEENNRDPEAMVDHYLEAGQTAKAFELLYKLAVLSAKKKDFVQSEAFRDRLYEIDSFALPRILAVNEVIDAEKSKAIKPDDRKLWSRFFEGLSPMEANALFLALGNEVFDSESLILNQGQPNDRLFFVTHGQLKMLYSDQDKEFLIEKLGAGDIFGEETFFSVNVCTVSVKTLTQVDVKILDRAVFEKLKAMHDTLEINLKKLCGAGRSVFSRLRQKGIDRRSFRRINLNTKVSFQLLASDAPKAMQRFVRAELWDISKGGLSFYFQSKNREAVRNLVGRSVGVRLELTVEGHPKTVSLTGVVHGVQSHPLDEYSVHLQFNRRLSDSAVKFMEHIAQTETSTGPTPSRA